MIRKFTSSNFFLAKIHPVLAKIPGYDYYLLRRKSYLHQSGWFKSFKKNRSIDSRLKPLPWFTYGTIELLKDRLPGSVTVFEYGCGLGTLWWSGQAESVHAVEHIESWLNKISKKAPSNTDIVHRPLGKSYVHAISEFDTNYDVIIIDGRNRVNCAKESVQYLTERGIIIFDDTGRDKYSEGVRFLKDSGFKQLPFKGFSPIEVLPCETSIFYRTNNLLGI